MKTKANPMATHKRDFLIYASRYSMLLPAGSIPGSSFAVPPYFPESYGECIFHEVAPLFLSVIC